MGGGDWVVKRRRRLQWEERKETLRGDVAGMRGWGGGHDAGLQGRGDVLARPSPGRVGRGPWRLHAGAREGREGEESANDWRRQRAGRRSGGGSALGR
jgi:hypothetical protein